MHNSKTNVLELRSTMNAYLVQRCQTVGWGGTLVCHEVSLYREDLDLCQYTGSYVLKSRIALFYVENNTFFFLPVTDATFPQIVPSKLQLFEFESVFIKCDGFSNDLTNWRVLRKIKGMNTTCNIGWETLGPCNIATAFSMDSGEYWCEAEGKKSNFVDIIVTGVFSQ